MKITEKQAIDYISGMVLSMRAKINIIESMDFTEEEIGNGITEYEITQDERIMCGSLEILLSKAKVNMLFARDKTTENGSNNNS